MASGKIEFESESSLLSKSKQGEGIQKCKSNMLHPNEHAPYTRRVAQRRSVDFAAEERRR